MNELKKALSAAELPENVKKEIMENLPTLLENVGESAKTVYDPNTIWLEAIQYADYVQQHAQHLAQKHGGECDDDSIETLIAMTISFKQMAESAMKVLDTLDVQSELIDWSTINITYGKDRDA